MLGVHSPTLYLPLRCASPMYIRDERQEQNDLQGIFDCLIMKSVDAIKVGDFRPLLLLMRYEFMSGVGL